VVASSLISQHLMWPNRGSASPCADWQEVVAHFTHIAYLTACPQLVKADAASSAHVGQPTREPALDIIGADARI
jgi:hypothetical protein